MTNKLKILGSVAAIGAIALVGSNAIAFGGKPVITPGCQAGYCCYSVPPKSDTGDEYYGPSNWDWCRNDYLASNATVFGLSSTYWSGHGWKDACNTDNPTGRFFTSVIALTQTSPDKAWPNLNDTGGDILRWGAGWAARVHDDLRANCAGTRTSIATTSYLGNVFSDYVTLWIPNNFYVTTNGTVRTVVLRASTLIHEASHVNGKHHSDDDKDPNWGFNGAWTYQAAWLAQYANHGVNAPAEMRCAAKAKAVDIVDNSFEQDPGFSYENVYTDPLCP